jgi:hypothetical protein
MKPEIESRFTENLDRVKHLVDVYQAAASGPGRRNVGTTDVLRAAVVFLHATLEDLLRSLLEWKLPGAAAEHLRDIPLEGKEARTKFTLDELAAHRGKTVDDLIARSVYASLEDSNFNHRADRNTASGTGQHLALPLQQAAVEEWHSALKNFGTDVLTGL